MRMQYLHTSFMGSYYVDCTVITDMGERSFIEYIDPVSDEPTKEIVLKSRLKPNILVHGDKVAKTGGQVKYEGTILTHYYTLENYLRYVVQIHPQGFQYIASPEQLSLILEFKNAV